MDRTEKIEALWNNVVDTLLRETSKEEVRGDMITAALRFLKDNNVDALATEGSPLDRLDKQLPFPKVGVG